MKTKNKTSILNLLTETRLIFKISETACNLETEDSIAQAQETKDQDDAIFQKAVNLREDILKTIEEERDPESEIDAETEKLINNSVQDLIMNIAHHIANYESQGPSGKKLILNNIRTETLLFFAKDNNSYSYKIARDHQQITAEAITHHLKSNLANLNPETLEIAKETILETLGFVN